MPRGRPLGYRIHIKIADQGWILEKCAREIAKRSKSVTYGLNDDPDARIQYYVNYSAYRKRTSPSEIAFFTHSERDEGARQRYFSVAGAVDHGICMSDRYADELRKMGIQSVRTISPGVDLDIFKPKVRIGVIGRTYHTGRKGEALVAQVMDVPGIEWRFTGSGWPSPSVRVADGAMPDFYNDLDYVLIPSLYEGGPMSVLEGLACGKPVISSDVGWVDKYPHIPFENGNAKSLRAVLEKVVEQRNELRESVLHSTWDVWAEQHLQLFEEIVRSDDPSSSLISPADDDSHAQRYTIVSHGSEKIARGGPTSRIANIVSSAAEMGIDIDVVSSQRASTTCGSKALVHVFNSWPLHTAIDELIAARKSGARVVYSPIALNLSYHGYYHTAISEILDGATDREQLEEGVEAVRKLTSPFSPDGDGPPPEGIAGHFQALRCGVALADHVVFLSEYERAFLQSIGANPSASTTVRNGVDAATMAAGDASLFQRRYGITDFVLIVGRIESRKNQALAAYALRGIKAPVVCIGHVGDNRYFQLLRRWSGGNFIHIERIDDRRVLAGAYKAARCLVLNSWAEGAPLVALEAAAAGTPLILSNMASEKEYFGRHANYVHPCDLDGLRSAVLEEIANPQSDDDRRSRSEMALERYDISRHTKETLAVYDRLIKSDARIDGNGTSAPSIALDNTHLAHHLTNSQIFTGVTGVEDNLSRAILRARPQTPSLVWSGRLRTHVETKFEEISKPGGARNAINGNADLASSFIRIANVNVSIVPEHPPIGARRAAKSAFKQSLEALPGPLNVAATRMVKVLKPNFQPMVHPEHRLFGRTNFPSVSVRPEFEVSQDAGGLQLGDRLLLLGQPWISNERMLDDLCELVKRTRLNLWAHVPDIVYVTDAASFDIETRKKYRQRLIKLLSVADTAVTISKAAETEIQNFIALNGLNTRTIRITLGISDQLKTVKPKRPRRPLPERFVMFVSSMNNRKRHSFITDVWADACAALKEAEKTNVGLLFVGSPQAGHGHYADPGFRSELAKSNIFVCDRIDTAELAWLYRNCLFTVYPARSEGWGIPPIESLYFGKPCIVSSTIPSAVETDCHALLKVAPSDYFGWVEALKSLLTSEGLRQALGKQAAAYDLPDWADAADILLAGQ